jgi:hypothetical protein
LPDCRLEGSFRRQGEGPAGVAAPGEGFSAPLGLRLGATSALTGGVYSTGLAAVSSPVLFIGIGTDDASTRGTNLFFLIFHFVCPLYAYDRFGLLRIQIIE